MFVLEHGTILHVALALTPIIRRVNGKLLEAICPQDSLLSLEKNGIGSRYGHFGQEITICKPILVALKENLSQHSCKIDRIRVSTKTKEISA